LRPFRAPMS